MVTCMKAVAMEKVELSTEERNLLSVAFKNVIGARRSSWRIMSSIDAKESSNENRHERQKGMIKNYKEKVSSFCEPRDMD